MSERHQPPNRRFLSALFRTAQASWGRTRRGRRRDRAP